MSCQGIKNIPFLGQSVAPEGQTQLWGSQEHEVMLHLSHAVRENVKQNMLMSSHMILQ